MKKIGGKDPPLRLDSTGYFKLHRQVLERDGWRYQACGSIQHLQVHHHIFRSQSGSDVEQNLITLNARNGRIGKPPRNLDRPINTKPTATSCGGFLMPLVRAPRHTERE